MTPDSALQVFTVGAVLGALVGVRFGVWMAWLLLMRRLPRPWRWPAAAWRWWADVTWRLLIGPQQ
jgi:hypothetical protein